MNFDAKRLYELLPAIYRIRDDAEGGPLRDLMTVLAEQAAVIEENLEQLYDDQFIETCADWVVPYIGDLIGVRQLHGAVPSVSSPRSEVANTIGYRRRKGTATMLEQLAHDATGWPARVVEFFELLAWTQYMNHIRPHKGGTADLRQWENLERSGGAFESLAHTVDVRRIPTRAGRFNIPNIGIFLWRIQAFRLGASPAFALDRRRFLFSPLGNNMPLYTRPEAEDQIAHLATPINVPEPISRRVLDAYRERYYGLGDKSLVIELNSMSGFSSVIPAGQNPVTTEPIVKRKVCICDLSDLPNSGGTWARMPTDCIAIDPVLGRIAFPNDHAPDDVRVSFHYGFAAEMGGGEYERADTFVSPPLAPVEKVAQSGQTIQQALALVQAKGGVVEITDNGRYEEKLTIDAGASIELRAANGCRPTLILKRDFKIKGAPDANVTLNGLLIAGAPGAAVNSPGSIVVPGGNGPKSLALRHCTLVPGIRLDIAGTPQLPAQPSLIVDAENTSVAIDKCIVGGIRTATLSECVVTDSIVDATAASGVAFDGPKPAPGGTLTLRECTVIGGIDAEILKFVSNTIIVAEPKTAFGEMRAPVRARRKQDGCVRFSYIPPGSIVPRRYRCQPDLAVAAEIARREKNLQRSLAANERDDAEHSVEARLRPAFSSLKYGRPDYASLGEACPDEIYRGADDESEMGAFHALYQPQRETNLRVRLDEYLRFGLDVGIFRA